MHITQNDNLPLLMYDISENKVLISVDLGPQDAIREEETP